MTRKFLVLSLSMLPAFALANEHMPDSVHHLNQVEVLGNHSKKAVKKPALSRTDVPLEKLPMTINTIDIKDLTQRGMFQPTEALRFSTGTGIRKTYGAFLQLSVRGFDYAPIVVDGMKDERTTFNSYPLSDLSDIESIEVLKGPASVLQGHSAVGGTMNITRRKAIRQTNASAYLSYGSFDQKRAVVSAGGYLGQGWSILSGLSYAGGEGWRSTGDRNFKVYTTANKVWGHNILDLRLSYNNDFYGTEAGLPAVFTTAVYDSKTTLEYLKPGQLQPNIRRNARYNNESDAMYHRNLNFTANWTSQLTDWLKVREQFSLNHDDIDYFSTEELSYQTSTELNADGSAPYAHYYMSKDKQGNEVKTFVDLSRVKLTYPLRFRHMAKTAQNQLSLEAKFDTYGFSHNLNAGYALSFMDRVSFTGYQFGPNAKTQDVSGPGVFSLISAYEPISAGPMETRFSKANPMKVMSHGFFVQDVIEFSPMLQAMLALRYDLYTFKRGMRMDSNDGGIRYTEPEQYDSALSQALTYRLGLVFTPITDLNIYTSVANFYKPYTSIYNPTTIYINKAGQEFIPTANKEIYAPLKGYQLELGTRVQLLSWLDLTASGFYIHQNNIIKSLGIKEEDVNGAKVKKNISGQVGTASSYGWEIDLRMNPIEGLDLATGYSYTKATLGEVASNPYVKSEELSGKQLAHIAPHKFYTFGSYRDVRGKVLGLEGHYSLSYTSERFRDQANTLSFEGYTQLDLGASLELVKNVRLGFDIYNVLNTESFQESLGQQMIPNAPRTFKVSLRYEL